MGDMSGDILWVPCQGTYLGGHVGGRTVLAVGALLVAAATVTPVVVCRQCHVFLVPADVQTTPEDAADGGDAGEAAPVTDTVLEQPIPDLPTERARILPLPGQGAQM